MKYHQVLLRCKQEALSHLCHHTSSYVLEFVNIPHSALMQFHGVCSNVLDCEPPAAQYQFQAELQNSPIRLLLIDLWQCAQ